MKKNMLIIVLIIFLAISVYYNFNYVNLDKDINTNETVVDVNESNSTLNSTEKVYEIDLNSVDEKDYLSKNLSLEIGDETNEENIVVINEESDIYYYWEKEEVSIHGVYLVDDLVEIYSLPEKDSVFLGQTTNSLVDVIFVVFNEEGEEWAFVESLDLSYFGVSSYGYIPITKLTKVSEVYFDNYYASNNEINTGLGLFIGDNKQAVINFFGEEYYELNGEDNNSIIYKDEDGNELVRFIFDPYYKRMYGYVINSDIYSINSGYKPGDSAVEAFAYYSEKYELLNESTDYATWILSEGCGIRIFTQGSELGDKVISKIVVMPIEYMMESQ